MNDRILAWEGCTNARDLGGLRTRDGRITRWGALVRSDTPARLTPAGWSALHTYGVRTIIALRTHGMIEDEVDVAPRPSDLATVPVAVEDVTDKDFARRWASSDLWSTPLYYADALRRWPERHAAVVAAVARARPGGVLIHCRRGNDRTGIVALLLLALVGVTPEEILADYELSPDPEREGLLANENTSVREVILSTVAGLDAEAYLLAGGLRQADLAAVRERLLG
jgi:protein-tyrosine phosphatase